MIVRLRRLRVLAALQLLLALPTMAGGTICVSTEGRISLELGFCSCDDSSVTTVPLSIGAGETTGCGPCSDQALTAMRSSRPMASVAAPATSGCAADRVFDVTPRVAGVQPRLMGQPPGVSRPILRC